MRTRLSVPALYVIGEKDVVLQSQQNRVSHVSEMFEFEKVKSHR